jgi:prepilin-type N-terminal cleavage/methylation domain-containing protein
MGLNKGVQVMKKNGFTLIELLATITILSIVSILLFSVFNSGIKQGEKTKKDVYLQQEANYVATLLRNTHLNKHEYTLRIDNDKIILDSQTISDKYNYTAKINYQNTNYVNNQTISITNSTPVIIELTFSKDGTTHTLRTTLSRGV